MPNKPTKDPLECREIVESSLTGVFAGIWLALGIGVVTTLSAPLARRSPCLKGAARFFTGIRVEDDKNAKDFFTRVLLGASFGMGLLLAAAALNWTVESADSINGDPS